MSSFTLTAEASAGATSISNLFIDHYMPKADGEYVKVYLYLLRALHDPSIELSVAGVAGALDHTENAVLRALKYWEKRGVLRLECNDARELQGIYLLRLSAPGSDEETMTNASMPEPARADSFPPVRRACSRSDLERFSEQAECRQLLFVCEQYLKKTLSSSEIETLFYFYDQLHFSADLIEYLVEYCVCKGSRSIHYIEKVALAWAEAGITTVAQAKERTTTYSAGCFSVMKAFGINDRNPVEPELVYIRKWTDSYGFTQDIIVEACRRTMERLHKPNFEYADRILLNWKENHVQKMADIQNIDRARQKRAPRKRAPIAPRSTGFTNFEQRDYDFDALEQQLLQSQ